MTFKEISKVPDLIIWKAGVYLYVEQRTILLNNLKYLLDTDIYLDIMYI